MRILSGVFQDERMNKQVTTGTPIALLIENVDARSKDYSDIRDKFRPGHADYTYWAKYGVRDYRGGGRQSARETASRVAAGAVARKVLDKIYGKIAIRGALVQVGTQTISRANWKWGETARNPFFLPRRQSRHSVDGVLGRRPQEGLLRRRGHRGGGGRCSRRPRRAALRQARRRHRPPP